MSLTEDLAAIASPPAAPEQIKPPSDAWKPHSDIGDDGGTIVTKAQDVTDVPDEERHGGDESDTAQILIDHGLTPSQWKVTSYRRSTWQGANGNWLAAKKLSIVPVLPGARFGVDMPDLDDLDKLIARTEPVEPIVYRGAQDGVTVVLALADLQIGKVDFAGGFEEFILRMEESRRKWVAYVKEMAPEEIIILDAGDIIENFESAPNADRVNDLSLTEQIRVARREVWKWIDQASKLAESVIFASVPSNHGAVRRGKNRMGLPDDDYGIEVNAQLHDIAAVNPKRYEHVVFHTPAKFEETLALKCVGGKILGLAHGHQAKGQAGIPKWWESQIAGRKPLAEVDVLVTGHWHNFRVETTADDRWVFGCPSADPGSSWYTLLSGNHSAPAVLSFVLDADGWRNQILC